MDRTSGPSSPPIPRTVPAVAGTHRRPKRAARDRLAMEKKPHPHPRTHLGPTAMRFPTRARPGPLYYAHLRRHSAQLTHPPRAVSGVPCAGAVGGCSAWPARRPDPARGTPGNGALSLGASKPPRPRYQPTARAASRPSGRRRRAGSGAPGGGR